MTPPPRSLGRPWRRDRLAFDPALDDGELAAARNALAQGRWTGARTLLAETGDDWDRRGHRLIVLAEVSASVSWARDWQLAEPDSADAAALLACSTTLRAVRGKASYESAQGQALAAARMAPADPSPWLALLILARTLGAGDDCARAFDQVRARYRDHHQAHHLMAVFLAERDNGGGDPLHEVYDFASWAAEQAPADSPLAVLPVVAHAERFRVLAASGTLSRNPSQSGHWSTRKARQVMKAAFDWWLEWEGEDHPRQQIDLNYLAHAKFHEGRLAEAAALFHRIGPHATRAPWSYTDRDPQQEFRAARSAALGSP
ncbi:hypothetical protein [Streptomyces zagrosensis]|uniref:Tetratricopeptide (TPR) repeat protein n=1 Tax=Streptomyces zagrosensis TaxID=1042984 RepID=A0A7W9UZF9_9ACTN|nr:hypothetical protein [Streptomyces zagrosensis]MBB5936346.1 tetratricopeptide (TPR) repeat protein [Streptomyces zagrosensis]